MDRRHTRIAGLVILALLIAPHAARAAVGHTPTVAELNQLSIEELANIQISSVSKAAESLSDAAAPIYVITAEAILRSGAASVPEMLRLAPNLQVAQITASSYAVSARGFNGGGSDKLLVLIDGRSVYTPFANGVTWELQEVLPADIERIEVISGPGATLWGANAVNGVINIITRNARETQGGLFHVGGGNREQRASLRYGGALGADLSYRAYVNAFRYDHSINPAGADAHDDWRKVQGGFRLDWSPGKDLVTLQGDYYRGSEGAPVAAAEPDITGHNLIARWNRQFDGGSTLKVQAYYDHIAITASNGLAERLNTYDLDIQHSFGLGSRQQIVWGGGYRALDDSFVIAPGAVRQFFDPQRRKLHLGNVFVQDTISLLPSLKLILGVKLEDDPYSKAELLPNAKLSWKVTDQDLLWASVSRAIRAPSRLDRDFSQTQGALTLLKGGDFQPERVVAYQVGYRAQRAPGATFSISAYYNRYRDLRNAEVTPGGVPAIPASISGVPGGGYPIKFGNGLEADTYGVEVWGAYQLAQWWRLDAGANWLHKDVRFKPGASVIGGVSLAGNDPTYQLSLRSSMTLPGDVTLDLDMRNIDSLPAPASPAYTELNARLAWLLSEQLQLSLRGSNLLHARHAEFGTTAAALQLGATGVKSGRSYYVDLQWRF